MKITDIKTLKEYDACYCEHISNKIPQCDKGDWKYRVGDCIYDFSNGDNSTFRKGMLNENCRPTDLRGCNALLSDCFYYFRKEVKEISPHLHGIIKKNSGHKKIMNAKIIYDFEAWINHGIRVSGIRDGSPYDSTIAERENRILKEEWLKDIHDVRKYVKRIVCINVLIISADKPILENYNSL